MIRRKWFTIGVAISLSAGTFARSIDSSMDQPWPAGVSGQALSVNYDYGFDSARSISQASRVSRTPWTGAWWWTQAGSVAVRWRTALYWNKERTAKYWPTWEQSDSMTYATYSADQLASMSEDEIRDSLSPIEKLDVVTGHANAGSDDYYKNLRSVRTWVKSIVTSYPEQLGFHGLCHGYSHAAIWLSEPNAVTIPVKYTLSNGREVTIPVNFGSGDLKALATYYYGKRTFTKSEHQAGFVGGNGMGMNPAQLHLLLTNLVRDADQSFVMDTKTGAAVWNYPVVGYQFKTYSAQAVSSRDADPRAVKEVYVATDVSFMGTTNPTQDAWGVTAEKRIMTKHYEYRLELTSDDQIVGGSWAPSSDRPDFAWSLKGQIPFEGDYRILADYWR